MILKIAIVDDDMIFLKNAEDYSGFFQRQKSNNNY